VAGHLRLNAGATRVEVFATDDAGRVCHTEWKTETRPPTAPKKIEAEGRITLMLHAAPKNPNSVTLVQEDIDLLAGSVSTFARNSAGHPLRVVVFNLDARKEFLRLDPYSRADSPKLRSTLATLPIATVDYHSAEQAIEPGDFLNTLLSREADDHTELVVFLGPISHAHKPANTSPASPPPCYYLLYRALPRSQSSGNSSDENSIDPQYSRPAPHGILNHDPPVDLSADTIQRFMQRIHGRTILFSSPNDLAHALDRIANR
jgi:hypothetical protein